MDKLKVKYDLLSIHFKALKMPKVQLVTTMMTEECAEEEKKTYVLSYESIIIILNEYKLIFYRIKYL